MDGDFEARPQGEKRKSPDANDDFLQAPRSGSDKNDRKSEYSEKKHKKNKKHKKEKKNKKDKKHKKHHHEDNKRAHRVHHSRGGGAIGSEVCIGVKREQGGSNNIERKLKSATKLERLEYGIRAHTWWSDDKLPDGIQWRSLEHSGIYFAPPYVPHGVPLYYDGKPIVLSPDLEEVASFYAAMPLDGPQLKEQPTRGVFQGNFFNGFKELLGKAHAIKSFEKCDFTAIRKHLDEAKQMKKALSESEKAEAKERTQRLLFQHGYALVDGVMQKVGNFRMEPPGLFRGRGAHPLTGKLKQRCCPEQVTLNMGLDAVPPRCAVPGHAWAEIVHKPDVTWLASWHENVMDANKYVMLAASSSFKGKSDMEKYTKAMTLKKYIGRIREDYERNLSKGVPIKTKKAVAGADIAAAQLATAMWIIDILALRVGGEKNDDEADTVGCCSLRVEHLTFIEDDGAHKLGLEFLGKDSMKYEQTIDMDRYGTIGLQVFSNLRAFCDGKATGDDVFETLTPPVLNAHLSSLMPGLTAKVFRTYNASVTLEAELPACSPGAEIAHRVADYNKANREVAILCNHQRTVPQSVKDGLQSMQGKLNELRAQKKALESLLRKLLRGEAMPSAMLRVGGGDTVSAAAAAVDAARAVTTQAVTKEEKIAAAAAIESARVMKLAAAREGFSSAHLFDRPPSEEQVKKRVASWEEKIRKMEVDMQAKDTAKDVALGTSKINYMDPRITVAWCKRNEVPIEKVFAKTLRDKFNWAMAVPSDWRFDLDWTPSQQ